MVLLQAADAAAACGEQQSGQPHTHQVDAARICVGGQRGRMAEDRDAASYGAPRMPAFIAPPSSERRGSDAACVDCACFNQTALIYPQQAGLERSNAGEGGPALTSHQTPAAAQRTELPHALRDAAPGCHESCPADGWWSEQTLSLLPGELVLVEWTPQVSPTCM
jgi:hypothetical protein